MIASPACTLANVTFGADHAPTLHDCVIFAAATTAGGGGANFAVTLVAAVIVSAHVDAFPAHAPPHPPNTFPLDGDSVSAIGVPDVNDAEHAVAPPPHEIPAGL